ncbi:MAG: MFS transporter [Gemmatimonadetes bacterium]|nr:MFS transporter [Gemmatimonadota bacterium]
MNFELQRRVDNFRRRPPSALHPNDLDSQLGKLVVLMITAFVDMVGMLMVVPLLPYYAADLGGAGMVVGILVSSFSVAQLISAPLWGRVSDRYGRRPALLIGLSFSAAAYIVFAYSTSLWLLLLSRVVQGAGGGTTGVIQAYVADATEPEHRAKSLGWISAATNAGVAIGPALGSLAFAFGREMPGLMAAALCLVNIMFAARFLRESHDVHAHAASDHVRRGSRDAVWEVLRHSSEPAPRLIWIYAIAMGAFQGTTAVLALFLAKRYGVTEQTIGYFFMYIGVISVVSRAGALGPLVDRFGEARLSRIGIFLLALGLATIPLTYDYIPLAAAVALLPLGTAFTFPCISSLLSRVIQRHERGLYMGVQQTFGGIARVIGPLWAGWAYDNLGMGVPFWTAALMVLGTLLLGADLEEYTRPKQVEPAGTATIPA